MKDTMATQWLRIYNRTLGETWVRRSGASPQPDERYAKAAWHAVGMELRSTKPSGLRKGVVAREGHTTADGTRPRATPPMALAQHCGGRGQPAAYRASPYTLVKGRALVCSARTPRHAHVGRPHIAPTRVVALG